MSKAVTREEFEALKHEVEKMEDLFSSVSVINMEAKIANITCLASHFQHDQMGADGTDVPLTV